MRICDLVVMKTVRRCVGDGSFNNQSEHGSASQEGGITQVLFSRDGNYLNTGGWKLIATSNLRFFLAGLVHLYDLQTGQWASAFQAALDTVNGFSFHPILPLAVSSSGHRIFLMLDEDDEDLRLSGDENRASVWR